MAKNSAHTGVNLGDLSAETWLITGCTHGVGLETARAASRAGARLILAARNTDLADRVAAELPGTSRVVELDLASLDSVGRAAAEVAAETQPIDVLVNNAGTVTPSRRETADGFEMVLGVNLLGPFAFTQQVLPQVSRRVVIVGSDVHKAGRIDFADPHWRSRRWSVAGAYSQSKLGDMLWGLALDRRLREAGSAVDVQLTHPGWAATNISNSTKSELLNRVITGLSGLVAQPAEQAALTSLFAATQVLPPCSYTGPDRMNNLRGQPTLIGRSRSASDAELAEKLWAFAESEVS